MKQMTALLTLATTTLVLAQVERGITSVTIAQDKSFTASAAKKATHDYNAVNVPGKLAFGIHTEVGGRISSVGGGLPVMVDGEVVGGIGISSGTPQQDMDCAQAGLDHFETKRG